MNHPTSEHGLPAWLRTWLLGVLILLLVRIVGDHIPLTNAVGWLWITRIGEAWTVLGLLAIGLGALPRREIAGAIGRWRSAALIGIGILLFVAQYVNLGWGILPFHKWDMYTGPAAEVVYVELQMVRDGESVGRLPLKGSISITREPRTVLNRIDQLLNEGADEALDQFIRSLTARSGVADTDGVQIRRCTVTDPTVDHLSVCEVLRVVSIRGSS